MDYITISEISKAFDISTRMLRYYEKIGLISSSRKEDYAYRIYDEEAVKRLQQVLLLRKLRIPLKEIAVILDDEEQVHSLEILRQNVSDLNNEISGLSTIRDILNIFVSRLDESISKNMRLDLLDDDKLIDIVDALTPSKINLKEDLSMEKLNDAQKKLDNKMEIRIIYLPPASVAAIQYKGENPEDYSGKILADFIKSSSLPSIKRDFRVYGFNNPSPEEGQKEYGYEFWATIPEDLEVPVPLVKKQFAGGLYAAHVIKMGDFHEWGPFFEQMNNSLEYEVDFREPSGMGGCMEEELNVYSAYTSIDEENDFKQLDLLIPIKKKEIKI